MVEEESPVNGKDYFDLPGRTEKLSDTAHVVARDRTCRFPTCHRPATEAEIDHQIPYAAGGTTGTAVVRSHSAGTSSVRMRSSTRLICSMALTPRNGMLPWAMRPRVSTSNQ